MMPEIEEPVCQNPGCRAPITIIPGHRRKQYCNDACRQAAFQWRQRAQQKQEQERQRYEADLREVEAIREQFGDLLPGSLQLLRTLKDSCEPQIYEAVGQAIAAERAYAIQSKGKQRSHLVEDVMLLAEQTGFAPHWVDEHRLVTGLDGWSAFVEDADLEQLSHVHDQLSARLRSVQRWKRVAQRFLDEASVEQQSLASDDTQEITIAFQMH